MPGIFYRDALNQALREEMRRDKDVFFIAEAVVSITTSSKAPVPHYYVTIDVDMDEALELKAAFKEGIKRVIDGLQAAQFLERLKFILENPFKLLMD